MSKGYIKLLLAVMIFVAVLPFVYYSRIDTEAATHLKKVSYQKQLEITGTIQASQSSKISLSYPVYIKESHVEENNYVNKGQLLFELDTEKMMEAVKLNGLTEYTEAYATMDKDVLMNVSPEIYANESGYVREIAAQTGDIVLAEENLCVIETDDELMLKITLNQENYSDISVGDRVVFNPAIAPARTYYGTISEKTAVIRKESSLTGSKTVIDVFASIDKTDEFITQGLQFSGTVLKENTDDIYVLPYEFINQDDIGEYVNVYSDGMISKVYVETGIETEEYVEILTEFKADTLFVQDEVKGKVLLKYAD